MAHTCLFLRDPSGPVRVRSLAEFFSLSLQNTANKAHTYCKYRCTEQDLKSPSSKVSPAELPLRSPTENHGFTVDYQELTVRLLLQITEGLINFSLFIWGMCTSFSFQKGPGSPSHSSQHVQSPLDSVLESSLELSSLQLFQCSRPPNWVCCHSKLWRQIFEGPLCFA